MGTLSPELAGEPVLVLELCGERLQVGAWVGVTRLMGVVETAGGSCAHMLPGILH